MNATKKSEEAMEQGENNKVEVNSATYSSSSSENDEATPNNPKAPIGDSRVFIFARRKLSLGEELNHAKCIEGHSYYKLAWSNKDLEHFHRPDVQSLFHAEAHN